MCTREYKIEEACGFKNFIFNMMKFPWKKCIGTLICLLLFLLLILCVCSLFICKCGLLCNHNTMMVIATICAAILAYLAYCESLHSRKVSNFDAIFTQQLSNHKDIFGKTELITPRYRKHLIKKESGQELLKFQLVRYRFKDNNAFANFYYFLKAHRQKDICEIWETYNELLLDHVAFSHCFKFVFHEIKTVVDNGEQHVLNDDEVKSYLGIIQSYMDYNELFCYLINLLNHNLKIKKIKNTADNKVYDAMREHHFFQNIMNKEEYRKVIEELYSRPQIQSFLDKLIKVESNKESHL